MPWWEPRLRVCVIWMVCASLCSRPCYIQVGEVFANGPKQLNLNYMLIPWVSEVIYYCDYLEFGFICMFLTSFYAPLCILCAQLVG